MSELTYRDVFEKAFEGNAIPYAYQCRLAGGDKADPNGNFETGTECAPHLIEIPTGLGKTAGVVLAWLWNRVLQPTATARYGWPRRLVCCLPMRTLVEQTRDNVKEWLKNLNDLEWKQEESHEGKVGVHILMGGEDAGEWDIHPEKEAILIGTQDMLLSRALNRGYGMSRYRWPMHFGLLNSDCLWVMDETQLMGPGLWTSGQLDWMRNHRFGVLKPCMTWWMSATPSPMFLDTPDRRRQQLTSLPVVKIGDDPRAQARLNPTRRLTLWRPSEIKAKSKKDAAAAGGFSDALATAVVAEHTAGTLSLVVCNSVRSAQDLYRKIYQAVGAERSVLLTSRFRRGDRGVHTKRLLDFEKERRAVAEENPKDDTVTDSAGLICISTQVVEAGVDISARRLWIEAAPWPSALQRLGRLNRDGRGDGKAQAFVFVWPQETKKGKAPQTGPYEAKDVETGVKLLTKLAGIYEKEPALGARDALAKLYESSRAEIDAALQPKDEPFPRAIDVHGLFSTEPDLFGGFTDVSAWVRGADKNADVTVFWREFDAKKGPGKTDALVGPAFESEEGCAVAIHRLRDFLGAKGRALVWDERTEEWQSTWPGDVCPGMVVMLPRSAGGYSKAFGWTGERGDQIAEVQPPGRFSETFEEDSDSESAGWVSLEVHLADATAAAERIVDALDLDAPLRAAVVTAAEMHDIGKSHAIWQEALPRSKAEMKQLWAKAPFVFVLSGKNSAAYRESTQRILEAADIEVQFFREEVMDNLVPRQLWTVSEKIRDTRSRPLRSEIENQASKQLAAWMQRFLPRRQWNQPCIRHEAASALAAWPQYFAGSVAWPGLTIFLVACHHGKVRTVLYARGEDGEDVCGVPKNPPALPWSGGTPMEFACAAVGTSGDLSEGEYGLTFTASSPGWTALIADLLGGWEARTEATSPPLALRDASEPGLLGPFKLSFLESLICASDIRASKNPSDLRHV
jgi:CRISPR-associated endonuclease/helicase Cas3